MYIFFPRAGGSMRSIFLVLIAALTVVACNSYKSKLQPQNEGNVLPAAIDYAFVNAKVFQPHCIRCHDMAGGNKGDVNLETYENVIANIDDIANSALVEKSMPPRRAGGPLGEYEQNVLKLWIDAGAPRDARSAPVETPTPEPTPVPTPSELPPPPAPPTGTPPPQPQPVIVEPTWDSIYTNVFEPKCVKCHKAGEKAEDYPLTDRAYVTDAANLLLIPGNPDESDIYTSIMRTGKGMMPPAKTGMTLSAQEKDAVRLWILNGAKD